MRPPRKAKSHLFLPPAGVLDKYGFCSMIALEPLLLGRQAASTESNKDGIAFIAIPRY
jgi:hypothetical protein